MKSLKYLLIAVLTISGISLSAQNGKALPDATLKTLEGKSVSLKDYVGKGKITILSFWATWCAPCKKELDAIAEVYSDWQKDYNVQILAITIDTQRELPKVKPMVATKGWEYIILSDAAGQLKAALNFPAVPQTYVVDAKGNIVYEHSGYVSGDELELEKKLKALKGK
jgi:cytochrome c biogenesis protein CcmG, thiol:disulfide interchange protein DsbE